MDNMDEVSKKEHEVAECAIIWYRQLTRLKFTPEQLPAPTLALYHAVENLLSAKKD